MVIPKENRFHRIPFWKLREEYHAQGYFDFEVAEACGMNTGTMSSRMQGKSAWRADEVKTICELLSIPQESVGYYFFPDVESRAEERTNSTITLRRAR